ncbi:MAG TPA: hypothetical protein VGE45_03480 [Chloroflexia bacterium]|jgi:hypothetical protein
MDDNFEARMMNDRPDEREEHSLSNWSVNAKPVVIISDRLRADIVTYISDGIRIAANTVDQLRLSGEPKELPRVYERGVKFENVLYRSHVLGPWSVEQESEHTGAQINPSDPGIIHVYEPLQGRYIPAHGLVDESASGCSTSTPDHHAVARYARHSDGAGT